MKSKIFYKSSVSKDFKRIDHNQRLIIKNQIEKELSERSRMGKKLKGQYEGLLSLRVGDYRVIYTLIPDGILVLRVKHRKEVYR